MWGAGGILLFRQLSNSHEARLAETVAGVRALLEEARESLRRDAALLAREVLVVEGDVKGEWFTLSGSQRALAVSVGRGAQLLIVIDPAGKPSVHMAGVTLPKIAPPEKPTGTLGILDDRAYVLGIAPFAGIQRSGGAVPGAFGVVILGRLLESLAPALARLPSRPAMVALAGDRAVSPTLPHAPGTGWEAATRSGRIVINDEAWALQLVSQFEGVAVWALVSDTPYQAERQRLRLWLLGSLAGAAFLAVGVTRVLHRRLATDPPQQ